MVHAVNHQVSDFWARVTVVNDHITFGATTLTVACLFHTHTAAMRHRRRDSVG